ncbi:major facilitator superfamily transporter [Colletotrichum karsti]|uniref:Major facilitator superfamily transporter n=1 Tax=Colletotrichum karsti TaxID=1095194 RepID=A0A9P6I4L3_9PEZI|nr:major facilitator superfamily transporter [Colletotrichum karsti]KAF9874916.1 major facilitator superfamily transporter [Colletotrichum karsti]
MPRLSDEVEAAHLMGAEYPDLEGLPADAAPAPGTFRAFQHTRPKWSRSPPRFGGWTGGRAGGALWALGVRINDALLQFQVRSPRAVILLLSLLKFSITTSGTLLMIPMLRLIEDDICHKHYRLPHDQKIPEMKCKVDEVQKAMAWLFGWQSLLGAIVNMLVAFPYGILSDRIGRKAVLILSFLGTVLSFSWAPLMLSFFPELNIYFLFVGMIFGFIGGGIVVMFNNVYAMAADVSTDKDRASNFVYMSAGAVIGGLIGPVTAGYLMEKYGPWIPIRLVFFLMPFIFLTMVLLPETLRVKADGPQKPQPPLLDAVRESFRNGLRELQQSVGILKNRNILFCLTPSLLHGAIMSAHSSTLSQYVSKHFGWTLAQTSYLLSPLGFLHLGILFVLPWLAKNLTDPRGRFRCTAFGKDALLAKGSYLMIALGAFIEGCSWEIVVFVLGLMVGTFGSASAPLVRAMITEFVDPEHTSRLYALTSMVDTLGSPLGGPVLAWTFSVGLEKKGGWRGLPWFYVSMLAVIVWAALMLVNEPRKKGPIHLASHDGDVEGMDYESEAEDEL